MVKAEFCIAKFILISFFFKKKSRQSIRQENTANAEDENETEFENATFFFGVQDELRIPRYVDSE